ILDIGGGGGFVSTAFLAAGYTPILVEPGLAAVLHAKSRGIEHLICATMQDIAIPDDSVAAAGAFDVIEHIEDDFGVLRDIHRFLRPGGRLYLTVPAFQWLWSDEDLLAGHFRRYTVDGLGQKLQDAGFDVTYISYLFRFLPLPLFLLRTLPYRLGRRRQAYDVAVHAREHTGGSNWTARMFEAMLAPEIARIRKRRRMRIGTSCVVCATKPARR
ncbi:MAG: class I SAM-dependent methyltransferase, partial [Candidatus Zixiibacteriota bacterium]